MIIYANGYDILDDKVPVLTKQKYDTYSDTNCWFVNFDTESEKIPDILSAFDYKDKIMKSIEDYKYRLRYTPVLFGVVNSNLTKQEFDVTQDVLAVALFLETGKQKPAWGDFFEVNARYRSYSGCYQNGARYKKVGTQALKCFQKTYAHQGITCRADIFVQRFYFKNGFERYDSRENFLCWGLQR